MPKIVFDDGYLIVSARHLSRKSDGTYYYQRRVPEDVRAHHAGKEFLRKSLKTKSADVAAKLAKKLAAEHDVLWERLRDREARDEGVTTEETRKGAAALLKKTGVV